MSKSKKKDVKEEFNYVNILAQEERQFLFKKNIKELYAIEKITGKVVRISDDVLLSSGMELIDGEITGLRLYGGRKLSIPNQISSIKSLKKLILKDFTNKKMPYWMGKLSNLEYLDLSGNFLEEIPDNLEGLTNLKYIDLGSNKLKDLPKSFTHLKSLETIGLSDNQLKELPKELLMLNNIRAIKLNRNNIRLIPAEIQNLRKLFELNVSRNPIKSISDELFSLPQLESLSLPNKIKLPSYIKKKIKKRNIPLKIYPKELIN